MYNIIIDEFGKQDIYLLKENISMLQTRETVNLNDIRSNIVGHKNKIGKYWGSYVALNRQKLFDGKAKLNEFSSWALMQFSIVINYFDTKCQEWHDSQPDPKPILESLPACWPRAPDNFPTTFDDFKFDSSCHPSAGPCRFHPGAVACYKSTTGEPQAQHCCYDNNGILLVGPPSGGTLESSNSDISVFAHYVDDVLPYVLCCVKENSCDKYYEKRPSDDGSRWVPPRITGGSGDPHFLTLDDLSYTFNGYGEYTLLDIPTSQFNIQIRIAPLLNDNNELTDGTVFKAIAVKDANDTIQLEINSLNQVWILYNGQIIDSNELDSIVFETLSVIITEDRYFIKSSKKISIEIGLTSEKNALSIVCNVPKTFNAKTRGLLGNFDGNPANDFVLPNGTIITLDSNDDGKIFSEYGQKWMTTKEESIFTYEDGFEHADFSRLDYVPKFMSDGFNFEDEELEEKAKVICKNNNQCLFDIATTGQLSIGDMTVEFEEQVNQYQELIELVENTCVRLNNPVENADTSVTELKNGLRYVIKCHESFCLRGKSIVKCENATTEQFPTCVVCESSSAPYSNNLKLVNLIFFISMVIILIRLL